MYGDDKGTYYLYPDGRNTSGRTRSSPPVSRSPVVDHLGLYSLGKQNNCAGGGGPAMYTDKSCIGHFHKCDNYGLKQHAMKRSTATVTAILLTIGLVFTSMGCTKKTLTAYPLFAWTFKAMLDNFQSRDN